VRHRGIQTLFKIMSGNQVFDMLSIRFEMSLTILDGDLEPLWRLARYVDGTLVVYRSRREAHRIEIVGS